MLGSLKRLCLGLILIALASAALLLWDLGSRKNAAARPKTELPAVALLQLSSNPTIDECVQGMVDGLADKGGVDGKTIRLVRFNAESDVPTANLIAKQITDGSYHMVITATTICLQAVGKANKSGAKVPHVFGAVTDPWITGLGISRTDPKDKPPYLTGFATLQPVKRIFQQAKKLNPGLKTVGVIWNPTEINSEVCVKLAREACAELGMTLLEAPIEKASDIGEAASSLAVRGVEAYWTGGDATVNTGINALMRVAHKERIPVFSNMYTHAKLGSLFDLGANYHMVGYQVGERAGEVLAGRDPAELPVEGYVPEAIMLNYQVLRDGTKGDWRFTEDLVSRADAVIESDGTVRQVKPQ